MTFPPVHQLSLYCLCQECLSHLLLGMIVLQVLIVSNKLTWSNRLKEHTVNAAKGQEVLWLCTHYYTTINIQVKAKEEGMFKHIWTRIQGNCIEN